MTKEEFTYDVIFNAREMMKKYPELRLGQSIFNYVDETYGVARLSQFQKGIDCFYNDDNISDFIDTCYELLSQ